MFGKVLELNNNEIIIENLKKEARTYLINCHVVFVEPNRKVIGEITFINENIIKIMLVGEINNNSFTSGVVRKPTNTSEIRIITASELEMIFGKNELNRTHLLLGKSAVYDNFNISAPLNDFFANHSAINGNTGSGKSCTVARIFQNLFILNPNKPIHSHVVLFDAYGEYVNTFNEIGNSGLKVKKYTTKLNDVNESLLKFPAYFLDVDDLAILLQISSNEQIPVLEKTLKLAEIFSSNDEKIKEYKNNIIANCIQDILTSGKTSTQLRDQIIAVLSHYNTETLNLDSNIHQMGYDRTLRQCLSIDNQGKMLAISDVMDFINSFERINLDTIKATGSHYGLEELYNALEFALISEGVINSDVSYDKNNVLKSRLQSIINSDKKEIFTNEVYGSKEEFVKSMFDNQVNNINLSYIEDRFAKILTKLYSKLIFQCTTSNYPRASYSFNIVLEEAHRYVRNDNDDEIIGYNIFDRIAKEGRKYGTLLTFITQRPSELSETALSQCNNFIVLRIYHPKDLEIIKNMSTNISDTTLDQIKTLNPGSAIAFGTAFKIPVIVNFDMPNPLPESTSVKVDEVWY